MSVESFQTVPASLVIPSYLYAEYADDANLTAFIDSFNTIAQGYVSWFTQTPLAVYTSPNVSGPLLDWIGQGIYGIPRPSIGAVVELARSGYDVVTYDTAAYDAAFVVRSGQATTATDDIYKRLLTWCLYRGDGNIFSLQWLKNRVARFVNGTAGADFDVLDLPPDVTVSDGIFTVTYPASPVYSALIELYTAGVLIMPFAYKLDLLS